MSSPSISTRSRQGKILVKPSTPSRVRPRRQVCNVVEPTCWLDHSWYLRSPWLTRRIAMLTNLNFGDRIVRQQQLGKIVTVASSFEWVWSSQFITWIQSTDKLFWITGHPASGKSTLINYLTNEERIREIVKEACGETSLLVSFFFDFRAEHGIRNNFQGLRRSLLYQLLSCLNDLASEVRTHFGLSKVNSHEWLGDDNTLASILKFVLRKLTVPVLLFLWPR